MKFQGAQNSYIQLPNQENGKLDLKGSMTVLAHVNAEKEGPLFHYKLNDWGLHWWISGKDQLSLFVHVVRRNMTFTEGILSPISRGQWNYVGFSYDKSTGEARLWIDGKQAANRSIGSHEIASQFNVRIGARIGSYRYFQGRITCMHIYAQALDEHQINEVRHTCEEHYFV